MPRLPIKEPFGLLNSARIRVEKAIKELEAVQNTLGTNMNLDTDYLLPLTFKALVECYALTQAIRQQIKEEKDDE